MSTSKPRTDVITRGRRIIPAALLAFAIGASALAYPAIAGATTECSSNQIRIVTKDGTVICSTINTRPQRPAFRPERIN
jgi:hypothetical protein